MVEKCFSTPAAFVMLCIMNEQVFSLQVEFTVVQSQAFTHLLRVHCSVQLKTGKMKSAYFVLINDEFRKIIVFVSDAVKPFIPHKKKVPLANIY